MYETNTVAIWFAICKYGFLITIVILGEAFEFKAISRGVRICYLPSHCLEIPHNTIKTSPTEQNGHHFTGNIFKCIFIDENLCILIQISPKFVPKDPIDTKSALVEVMAWCQSGDKPLPEPMLTQFTDIYAVIGGDELIQSKICKTLRL